MERIGSREVARNGRRAAQGGLREMARYVEARLERRDLPDDHPSRVVIDKVGMVVTQVNGRDVVRFVDGPSGNEAFRLDKGFVELIETLGHERFYACAGSESSPACHIASADLVDFIRSVKPELVTAPVAVERPALVA